MKYAAFGVLACLALIGCDADQAEPDVADAVVTAPTTDVAITAFCSACHPMPNPTSFARDRWHHEVRQGIDLYRKSQRTDLEIPDFDATLAWFERFAPAKLSFDELDAPPAEAERWFQPIQIPIEGPAGESSLIAVSHVSNPSPQGEPPSFVMADMGGGDLFSAKLKDGKLELKSISRVSNPAHIEPADLDGDGVVDYVVADLGGLFPGRQKLGSLWWLRPQKDGGWQRIALKMGMMRVSDVRTADFDGDGDLDLVVAEFGWHYEGGIHLFTNTGIEDGVPQFEPRVLDDRAGAIHVPIIDLNGDGRPDFVALISQHYETIVAFINQEDGTFRKETIFEAGDPAYGSSGIELVDIDRDGDIDVLMSNGDTFDDQIPKPSHSIQWLENQGVFPYKHHEIGQMPGAYRAVAGDIDRDGDIDIAAVSLLVKSNIDQHPPGTFDGVVFFEQMDDGKFIRHRLQSDRCHAATCQLMDWDADGDLDVVTFPYNTSLEPSDSITVFRNDR